MQGTFVPKRVLAAGWPVLAIALICACVLSGQQETKPDAQDQESAVALINQAAANEVAALRSTGHLRYRETVEWKWGTETREVIATPEGRADRIVSFNHRPLAADQEQKQEQRLKKLISDPDAVRHELADQKDELKRRIALMKAFPTAFLFTPDGEEDGKLKFSFRPTGSFSPHDRETQIYRGLEGTVWVEPDQKRLTRIDGIVTKNVSFGWGVFGKLYKGGRYLIEQTQIEPGAWQITKLDLDLKLRVFLSTSRFLRNEANSGFAPVPAGTTYKQALELLLDASSQTVQ
ncbi:MAG TPA: hypothetical protein VJV96_13370 [Candidatus Angelobacter sp.]|nr:hypothetical protein [Candidatus Angelobacter sp.]